MAGGIGSRFWPLSRSTKPKQFLDILGTGKTLIQQTFDRFAQICPKENIYIVSSDIYRELILEQLPEMEPENVLLEPMRRNTAPCIAYANHRIIQKNSNANIVVSPSDHLITNEMKFVEIIKKGLEFTNKNQDKLLTLGIKPHRPETGYGYIQISLDENNLDSNTPIKKVKTFTEKPEYEMAKVFMESGEFLWNSGIFLWHINSIMKEFDIHLPEINKVFAQGGEYYNTQEEERFIQKIYPECKNISIDYGIMEKAENVHVYPADFGWSDLGTWMSLKENSQTDENNNLIIGKNIAIYESEDCIVNIQSDKLVVLHGLKNLLIAQSKDILFISSDKDESQLRKIVNEVKLDKGLEYM